jgi:predicted TIM-barrel fold metal-dependent hydrolase
MAEDLQSGSKRCFGNHRVIDVDTHFTEPHDLWTRRAPASIRDRVPQVKFHNGQKSWVINGDTSIGDGAPGFSAIRPDGTKIHELEAYLLQIDQVHPASSQLKERLELMDQWGIDAQLVYPNILGFGGQNTAKVDPGLRLQCTQIYNDAMAEMQDASGGRFLPMALLPWWDAKLAAREAERAQVLGLKGVNINSDPHTSHGLDGAKLPDLSDCYWDALWELCVDRNLPINFHIGASEQSTDWYGVQAWPSMSKQIKAVVAGSMIFFNNGRVMGNLILSGILDRFSALKFVSVESGIGWIPFLLQSLDYQYKELSRSHGLQMLPSEYFKRNFYGCFWFERGERFDDVIRSVGIDNVMFETDFPHPTCLYPIDDIAGSLGTLSYSEVDKVLNGNARKVYEIELRGGGQI